MLFTFFPLTPAFSHIKNCIIAAFPLTLEMTAAASMRRYESSAVEQFHAAIYFFENFKPPASDVEFSNFIVLIPRFLTVLEQ